jgi:(p)ppGpp synthase/HD superfamily hydrolase
MNPKIIQAIELAFMAHEGQVRKGSNIPYIVHPMAVMNLLLIEQSEDQSITDEVIIGGILHDVFEDTDVTLAEIEKQFGDEVRRLVENSSEPEELKKSKDQRGTWKERKIHTIQQLSLFDKSSKIISCCDKLHNAQSMNTDFIFVREKLWERFNAPKEDIFWYYRSCLDAYKIGVSIENSKTFALLDNEVNLLCSH